MAKTALALVAIGVFMFAVATGQAIPNIESMIINFAELGEGTQLLYQISVLGLGFGAAIYLMEAA